MSGQSVKRAAIYARISKADSAVDKSENQVEELKKLAAAHGYEVVRTYVDDDTSAYRGESYRPAYISLITGIKDGLFDVVMATEPQRFTRGSAAELEALAMQMAKANVTMHTRAAGVQDPSKMTTFAMMQIMDIIGGLEVATKIERQRARNAADISKGIPTKGLRPFGWEKDRMTLREAEARHIRAAYDEILSGGASVWSIAQKWNSIGLKTDSMTRPRTSVFSGLKEVPSGVWTTTTVRQMLTRPRNAGILTSDGVEMPVSKIQPIVSREDFDALCSAIKGENTLKGPKPKYLLGGILECPCGARMNASKSNTQRVGRPKHEYQIYRCRLYGFDKSKKHATIQLSIADRVARDEIVADIGLGLLPVQTTTPSEVIPIKTKIANLRDEIETAVELIYSKLGDSNKHKGRIRRLEAEIAELERQQLAILSEMSQTKALDAFTEALGKLEDLASDKKVDKTFRKGFEAWDSLTVDQQRNIIKANYRVLLMLGGRGVDRIKVVRSDRSGTPQSKVRKR